MKHSIVISEADFDKVVPWWVLFIPFYGWDYSYDAMTIGHYGSIEYGYDEIEDLPKYYQKLIKDE